MKKQFDRNRFESMRIEDLFQVLIDPYRHRVEKEDMPALDRIFAEKMADEQTSLRAQGTYDTFYKMFMSLTPLNIGQALESNVHSNYFSSMPPHERKAFIQRMLDDESFYNFWLPIEHTPDQQKQSINSLLLQRRLIQFLGNPRATNILEYDYQAAEEEVSPSARTGISGFDMAMKSGQIHERSQQQNQTGQRATLVLNGANPPPFNPNSEAGKQFLSQQQAPKKAMTRSEPKSAYSPQCGYLDICVSANGEVLAALHKDSIDLYDAHSLQHLRTFKTPFAPRGEETTTGICLNATATELYVANGTAVRVLNPQNGAKVDQLAISDIDVAKKKKSRKSFNMDDYDLGPTHVDKVFDVFDKLHLCNNGKTLIASHKCEPYNGSYSISVWQREDITLKIDGKYTKNLPKARISETGWRFVHKMACTVSSIPPKFSSNNRYFAVRNPHGLFAWEMKYHEAGTNRRRKKTELKIKTILSRSLSLDENCFVIGFYGNSTQAIAAPSSLIDLNNKCATTATPYKLTYTEIVFSPSGKYGVATNDTNITLIEGHSLRVLHCHILEHETKVSSANKVIFRSENSFVLAGPHFLLCEFTIKNEAIVFNRVLRSANTPLHDSSHSSSDEQSPPSSQCSSGESSPNSKELRLLEKALQEKYKQYASASSVLLRPPEFGSNGVVIPDFNPLTVELLVRSIIDVYGRDAEVTPSKLSSEQLKLYQEIYKRVLAGMPTPVIPIQTTAPEFIPREPIGSLDTRKTLQETDLVKLETFTSGAHRFFVGECHIAGNFPLCVLRKIPSSLDVHYETNRQLQHPSISTWFLPSNTLGFELQAFQFDSKLTLDTAIEKAHTQMSIALCLRIAKQILEGVAYLHRNNLLHLNLSTHEVFIDSNWNARIVSPTCAYKHDGNGLLIGTLETIVGDINYAAKEILTHPPHYSDKADAFACGAILHALFSGMTRNKDALTARKQTLESVNRDYYILKKPNIPVGLMKNIQWLMWNDHKQRITPNHSLIGDTQVDGITMLSEQNPVGEFDPLPTLR